MADRPKLQQSPVTTVREFLAALEVGALDEALDLLDARIVWKNTSLPDVRGTGRVGTVLRGLNRRSFGFRADMHHIAAEGAVVLTERTDHLRIGRLDIAFWVCGTFELVDDRIVLWHDHFSWGNFLRGTLAGAWRALRPRTEGAQPHLPH